MSILYIKDLTPEEIEALKNDKSAVALTDTGKEDGKVIAYELDIDVSELGSFDADDDSDIIREKELSDEKADLEKQANR